MSIFVERLPKAEGASPGTLHKNARLLGIDERETEILRLRSETGKNRGLGSVDISLLRVIPGK